VRIYYIREGEWNFNLFTIGELAGGYFATKNVSVRDPGTVRETVQAKNKQTIFDQKEDLHISNRTNMKLMIYSKQFAASSINILGCVVIFLYDHKASGMQNWLIN
jgi:hypothetical protein